MRFDVQDGRAIYGVEADDGEYIIPMFQKFDGGCANGVGSCRTAGGEDTDQRQVRITFGMHFHYGALGGGDLMHPVNDNDVGKFVYSTERLF